MSTRPKTREEAACGLDSINCRAGDCHTCWKCIALKEQGLRQTFEVEAYRQGQQLDVMTAEVARAREILAAIPHGPTMRTLCQLAHNAVGCAQGRRRRIERMGAQLTRANLMVDLMTTGFLTAVEELTKAQARLRLCEEARAV